MKAANYREVRRLLKATYFKPDDESRNRLFEKLHIERGVVVKEYRFVTRFRITLAAVVTAVCLLSVYCVDPQYLDRYSGENVQSLSELLSDSPFLEKLIPDLED